MADYADAMTAIKDKGSSTKIYSLNSHGNDGVFFIGNDEVTKTTDFSILKEGLSNKNIFIGACLVSSGSRGTELIQNFSNQTSSTVYASDHEVISGYKYDGENGLTQHSVINTIAGLFGNNYSNSYHMSKNGSSATQIYNLSINKSGNIEWNNGNRSLFRRITDSFNNGLMDFQTSIVNATRYNTNIAFF